MILFLGQDRGDRCHLGLYLKMVPLVTAGEVLWQASSVGGTWSLSVGDMGEERSRE